MPRLQPLSRATTGVMPIVPTPFTEDGALSVDCVGRLVDYYERCGVVGLTILGVMGEAGKLSPLETSSCIDAFLASAAGRLPVVVGVSSVSLAASVDLAKEAMDKGAAGVMLQPMPGLKGDQAVVDYYARFIDRTAGSVPICVQDYPQANGVDLLFPAWSEIAAFEAVFMLKHEPPAGLGKLTTIRQAEQRGEIQRVSILTSNNAMHLSEELARGADGAMVGVAYSDLIVAICALYRAGETDKALDLYDALLPLVRHETQGGFGLAIRKEILKRRGALKTGTVRYPGATLTAADLSELDALQSRLDRRLQSLGLEAYLLAAA